MRPATYGSYDVGNENVTLKIEKRAYEHALVLVGERLAKQVMPETNPPAPETTADASAASAKEESI